MHIAVIFQFVDERQAAAVTEVEGAVTDIVLPDVGDTVSHTDLKGHAFQAQVVGRHFDYSLGAGEDVDGSITVVLSLQRMSQTQIH